MSFTQQAQQTLEAARQEALDLDHGWVGTEHLLLGLVRRLSEVGPDGFPELRAALPNVSPEAVRAAVLRSVPPATTGTAGDAPEDGAGPRLTPRMHQVLESARQISFDLGNDHAGDEHLLLGVLRDRGGVAQQVLRELGVTYENVHELVASSPGVPTDGAPASPESALLPPPVRMTPGAVRTFEMARQLAEDDELTGGMLGTHHYLLALTMEVASSPERGLAAGVLGSLGVTYGSVKALIDGLDVRGTSDAPDWSTAPPPHDEAT